VQLRLRGGRWLWAVATIAVMLLSSPTGGGVSSAKPVARTASACSTNYGYSPAGYFLEVGASHVRFVACRMALLVGRAFWYRYSTGSLSWANYPPPVAPGFPGGRSKPFELKTPLGYMRCVMDERGSDFIDGDCRRFGVSMHLYVHRDCCRAADVSSADRSARLASSPRPPGRQIG
jgi:hypothetical protein